MSGPPLHVLYADGDDAFVSAVERDLDDGEIGFELTRARTYAEAVAAVDAAGIGEPGTGGIDDIDCVVADRDLGSGTGLDLLERVRSRDPDFPFVFVADGDERVAAAAIGAGVTDYVRKRDPEAVALIGERIRRAVASYRAERARHERTRELATLHAVSAALAADAPLSERLEEVVTALPTGWQRPDRTAARLAFDGVEYRTPNFVDDPVATQSVEVTAGETTVRLTVADVGDPADLGFADGRSGADPDDAPGVFLPEEADLLRSVADLVAVHVDRAETAERLEGFAGRLDAILQHTTNIVFMKDLEGRYVLVNDAFVEFVGRGRDEVIGRTAAELHDASALPWIDEHDAETLRVGELRRFEEHYPRPDGVRRFVTVRVPLFDEDGEPYAMYGIATDITEETRLAEERVELLDRMTDGFVAVDGDGHVTYANDRAAGIVDREPAELVGKPLEEAFPGVDNDAFATAFAEAKATGEATAATGYVEPLDRWFESRVYPSESGVSMYFRDVTESVRERRELERRERTMRRLYEAIAGKDETFETKVGALLALGKETLGVESGLLSRAEGDEYTAEVVDDDTGAFERGATTPIDATNCERVIVSEESLQIGDVGTDPELSRRAGFTELGISCYLGAPVVVDDDVYGTFCFYDREERVEPFSEWEVTLVDLMARWVSYELERRAAEAETARERDRLETFAGTVSHDLRNPLNVAAGHVDLAREDGDSPGLARAADALDRMAELIDDALSFARLGTKVVDVERVDLDDVVREAWATVDVRAATLVVADPGTVAGDRSRIRTLFENLFRNAVEHGGDDVTVTVTRTTTGFRVDDDGPGIPADGREHVFELGYTTSEHGTGFGLGIVSQIAAAHGWRVEAAESDDGGARIAFHGVPHLAAVPTRQ